MSAVVVAVLDSGINPDHPHVGPVAGGVALPPDGSEHEDWADRLGHGTAVAAVIREKAPATTLLAVRIFERGLTTNAEVLIRAIDWAVEHGARLVNLSLGTANPAHEPALRLALERALAQGALVVAAAEHEGARWLPGALPGAVGVVLDWSCPRDAVRVGRLSDGRAVLVASGFPRPIPGVPPERNLSGISFAVANATGVLARLLAHGSGVGDAAALFQLLAAR